LRNPNAAVTDTSPDISLPTSKGLVSPNRPADGKRSDSAIGKKKKLPEAKKIEDDFPLPRINVDLSELPINPPAINQPLPLPMHYSSYKRRRRDSSDWIWYVLAGSIVLTIILLVVLVVIFL
jgi:hypothetical protein